MTRPEEAYKNKRSHVRATMLFTVYQGRPMILATRNMLHKQLRKIIIMSFSVTVISFHIVFSGFFFTVAYFRFPDQLTTVVQGLSH